MIYKFALDQYDTLYYMGRHKTELDAGIVPLNRKAFNRLGYQWSMVPMDGNSFASVDVLMIWLDVKRLGDGLIALDSQVHRISNRHVSNIRRRVMKRHRESFLGKMLNE